MGRTRRGPLEYNTAAVIPALERVRARAFGIQYYYNNIYTCILLCVNDKKKMFYDDELERKKERKKYRTKGIHTRLSQILANEGKEYT